MQKPINSELRYRRLFEAAQDGILILDAETGMIEDVNPSLIKMLGYSREELVGKKLSPKDAGRVWEVGAFSDIGANRYGFEALHENETLHYEDQSLKTKDGRLVQVEFVSNAYQMDEEKVIQCNIRDITERKRAEQEIASLAKFPSENPNPVLRLSRDGALMYANPASDELLSTFECVADGSTTEFWRDLAVQALASGEIKNVEIACNGKVYAMSIVPIAKPGYVNIYGRDITDGKRAEETLRESEDKFKYLFEHSSVGKSITLLSGEVNVNQAFCEMLGFSHDEFKNRSWQQVSHPDDIEVTQREMDALLSNEKDVARFTKRFLHKNGSIVWTDLSSSLRRDKDGKPLYFITTIIDITERKQAEDALRESEERYRLLVETLPDGVIVHSQGRIVFANQACAAITGVAGPADLIGKPVIEFVHPDYRELALKRIQQSLTEGGTVPIVEEKFVRWDGTPVDVEVSAVSFSYAGKPAMLTVFNDITKRKQTEMEIGQRLRELEVLYQSGLAFSQLIKPRAIAEKIIELLDQEMDWHHTTIRLYHPKSKTLELLAFNLPNLNVNSRQEYSAAEERFKTIQRPDQGFSGWVIQHGQAVRSNDLKNDPRYFETFPGSQSGLYVPIKIAERVIGVISIESERPQAFSESDERLATILAMHAAVAMDDAQLFESLRRSNINLASAYEATIEGWSRVLDLRDKETEGHSQRVMNMTLRLARSMGLNNEELVHVRRGALLHDIGKMGVPDGILLKPGPLTGEEWVTMRKHPTFAYEMLSPIRYLRPALDIPYCHHEKWDGSGYPRGLAGAQIPLAARIFAVVDVWDALNSDRSYRNRWEEEKVREYIHSSSGTHFDPLVVDMFMRMIKQL